MATTEKKPRTPAQIAATEKLRAANAAKRAAAHQVESKTNLLGPDQLFKVIGGDWGNNYGHIQGDPDLPTVSVALVGSEVVIDVEKEALLPVPYIGA